MKLLIKNKISLLLRSGLVAAILLTSQTSIASTERSLPLPNHNEVTAEVFGQPGKTRILWIAPGYGFHPRHKQVAEQLGKLGFEVWQVDLADALFMTRGTNTLRSIDPKVVADIIRQLTKQGQHLLVVSSSYGSIPTLRGVQQWQSQHPTRRSITGVVLFTPYLYTKVPPLGQTPDFIPVATSVPIYIFEAEKNGNRWHFAAQLQHLRKHTTVYSEIMKGVTSLFYEEDQSQAARQTLTTIAKRLQQRSHLLAAYHYPLTAPKVSMQTALHSGIDEKLKPYHGSVQPLTFSLKDINGNTVHRPSFKGKVTIINFWASWCRPCVEEIPSLNRLRNAIKAKNFELISINYAETAAHIKKFMHQVAVDYPVLVDPEGKLAGRWNVVAFPSTFVIGTDGQIKYGVNAAIHWDTPEIIKKITALAAN